MLQTPVYIKGSVIYFSISCNYFKRHNFIVKVYLLKMLQVLLIEDEQRIAELIKRGLEEQGFVVMVAYDGEIGKKLALGNNYYIIITDIVLPKISGIDLFKEIRLQKPDIPIIMLTALQSKFARTSKPFSKWMVYRRITVANTYCTHDTHKENSIYTKFGYCNSSGINLCNYAHWNSNTFFTLCKCHKVTSTSVNLFSMAYWYFNKLLPSYTSNKKLVHQKI